MSIRKLITLIVVVVLVLLFGRVLALYLGDIVRFFLSR